MSVHLIHNCWHCGDECWCENGDVDPKSCAHICRNREDDGPHALPDEFDDDETCDFTEEDVVT